MPASRPQPVVVITGPTAAGKTDLAIALARRFEGEIINADSMQVYRGLDIGTAKPSLEQRAEVPHHLVDIVPPDTQYNAGRFAEDAERAAEQIRERGRAVFLCGGSGLYLRAFLEGLVPGASGDPAFRAALEAEHRGAVAEGAPQRLHQRLRALDPETAAEIHPNDLVRIGRALEIHRTTGRLPSVLRRETAPRRAVDSAYLVIDPGREELGKRIDARCLGMIEGGLLQEVRELREQGYGPELPSMKAIGYRHMQPVIEGSDTLANALLAMQRDTRQFARRQRTWFRGVEGAEWLDPLDERAIIARVGAALG